MYRVYQFPNGKKGEITKVLESDPYADDSFARIGYKIKDGNVIEEDKMQTYIYFSASEEFLKNAEEKLKGLAERCKEDVEKRVIGKIQTEEESAEAGLGNIFGPSG
ncbi:hypothetical protein HZC07_05955 [Candidatus Micrarchaeota archaeon]|nr:hypothetical protein [Candidatus Micrarchaeota archaeon]